MLLTTVYTLSARGALLVSDDLLPLDMNLDKSVDASLVRHGADGYRLLVRQKVARHRLTLVEKSGWQRADADGQLVDVPALRVRGTSDTIHVLVRDLTSALSFLCGVPLNVSRVIQDDRFEAQDTSDRELLETLGTDTPYHETSLELGTRTFRSELRVETINSLMSRRAGLRIYADALQSSFEVATFRDLWRVLESAFGTTDDELVDLLLRFPPATDLGFDSDELRELLILRGRASHAQSRAGVAELVEVESSCHRHLPRLSNLAERVILTKKSWGHPTVGVEEVLPLRAYVDRTGTPVIMTSGSPRG